MEELPASGRGLSVDQAISIAIVLQQNEQWSAAADIYRGILDVAPDCADALHFSGCSPTSRRRASRRSR